MSEGSLIAPWEISPTAASAHNRLYDDSGVIKYRVVLAQTGGARMVTNVEAATGDGAADMALQSYPGWKVAYVGPATKSDAITPTEEQ